jgi:hypothetical protein
VAEDRAVVLLGSLDHGSSDHRASKTSSEKVYMMLAELSMSVWDEYLTSVLVDGVAWIFRASANMLNLHVSQSK